MRGVGVSHSLHDLLHVVFTFYGKWIWPIFFVVFVVFVLGHHSCVLQRRNGIMTFFSWKMFDLFCCQSFLSYIYISPSRSLPVSVSVSVHISTLHVHQHQFGHEVCSVRQSREYGVWFILPKILFYLYVNRVLGKKAFFKKHPQSRDRDFFWKVLFWIFCWNPISDFFIKNPPSGTEEIIFSKEVFISITCIMECTEYMP